MDAVLRAGVVPSLMEILDRTTLHAVDDWKRLGLDRDAGALLLLQSDAPDRARRDELDLMLTGCDQAGASYVAFTDDPLEGEQLLEARRIAYPALERLGEPLLDDVAVPPSRVPELLSAIETIADRRQVMIGTFGHAGDGNMHPTIIIDRGAGDSRSAARDAFEDIMAVAIELGGTITGEHGVGVLKNSQLRRELAPEVLEVHRSIKSSLDPQGLLNPGKALGL